MEFFEYFQRLLDENAENFFIRIVTEYLEFLVIGIGQGDRGGCSLLDRRLSELQLDDFRRLGRRLAFSPYRLFFDTLFRRSACLRRNRHRLVPVANFDQRLQRLFTGSQTGFDARPSFRHRLEEILNGGHDIGDLVLLFLVGPVTVIQQRRFHVAAETDQHRLNLRHGQHHRYTPDFFQQ